MQLKPVVQGLAVAWLLLFLVSFIGLQAVESDGSFASGLNRVVVFLTWQGLALVVAAIGAFCARLAIERGAVRLKFVGYGPLAVSVFLVAMFIAIMAYRFQVAPLFE